MPKSQITPDRLTNGIQGNSEGSDSPNRQDTLLNPKSGKAPPSLPVSTQPPDEADGWSVPCYFLLERRKERAVEANRAQQDYWTSPAGLKWIEHEHALDMAMAEMLEVMLVEAGIAKTDLILDVGCGTGASTLAAARRAPGGEAVGIDISKPLLDRAAHRAREAGTSNASFILADAQTHQFPNGSFDVMVSRVGMSFFSDSVAALQNLRSALKRDGRMAFVCWAAVDHNPWFHIPKKAAEERLGALPKTNPRDPGPTAFQDLDYVAELMARAGLSGIGASAIDITLTPPDGVCGAARAASRVGPAARIIKAHGGDDTDEHEIEKAVLAAFRQFDRNGEVRVPAVVNLFTCHT